MDIAESLKDKGLSFPHNIITLKISTGAINKCEELKTDSWMKLLAKFALVYLYLFELMHLALTN